MAELKGSKKARRTIVKFKLGRTERKPILDMGGIPYAECCPKCAEKDKKLEWALGRIDTLNGHKEDLAQAIDEMDKRIKELEAKNERLDEETNDLRQEDDINAARVDLKKENAALRKRVENLVEQLQFASRKECYKRVVALTKERDEAQAKLDG